MTQVFDALTGDQRDPPERLLSNASGQLGPPPATWGDNSSGQWLLGPALFDPQVNGFAGVDFQDPELERDALEAAALAVGRCGCSHFLVTLVTNTPEFFVQQLSRIADFIAASPLLAERILGFHIEGPFLTAEAGYIGAHPPDLVRPASVPLFEEWQRAAGGRIRLLTLSPEVEGAEALVRHVASSGVTVAAGHTNASLEQLRRAAAAGVTLFTHLGNGCATQVDRHDSIVQRALAVPELGASVIPDGIHLPPFVLANMCRALGPQRLVATTDAVAPAGAAPGSFRLGDVDLVVGTDRVVRNPRGEGFAGSALTMRDGLFNLIRIGGLGVGPAWRAWTGLRNTMFPGLTAPMIAVEFPAPLSLPV
jgi:N-acetylglucosamine-6-phosphate deacetylase